MATVTLRYDARNSIAQKTIDYVLSLGIFEKKPAETGLEAALNDVKYNRVYKAKNAKDLIEQCLK